MKRLITTVKGGGILSLTNIGLEGKNIKQLWTVYDEDRMWESNQFNPFTGKAIVKGEQESLEGLILQHGMGVLIEDIVHDWRVTGSTLRYYSRYTPKDRETKILIEYQDGTTK